MKGGRFFFSKTFNHFLYEIARTFSVVYISIIKTYICNTLLGKVKKIKFRENTAALFILLKTFLSLLYIVNCYCLTVRLQLSIHL